MPVQININMPKSCDNCPFLFYKDTNLVFCYLCMQSKKDESRLFYNVKSEKIEKPCWCPLKEVK